MKTQEGARYEIGADALPRGHVIRNETWFPIATGALEELSGILREAGISPNGDISTLRGLLALKSAATRSDLISDRLSAESVAALKFLPGKLGTPAGVNATLYPYQLEGWRWLRFVVGEQLGGILADEMGLGKTLQIISAICDPGTNGHLTQALIVAPGSLLENWRRELVKFAPHLTVLKHHGNLRTGRPADLLGQDVVIASYETVVRDLSLLKMVNWSVVVIDEAQNIKNPEALRTKSVKQLPRRVALAMTGTPMENRLSDLWSILDFAVPGYLGDLGDFNSVYGDTVDAAARLEPLISPLILRRMVTEVAQDLPERIDIPEVIQLSEEEAADYDRIRDDIFAEHGTAATLVSLTRLRQFCAHPALLERSRRIVDPKGFSKFARLLEILSELISSNEKAIVFTSYTLMADMIADTVLNDHGIFAATLDGRLAIDARQPLIDQFGAIQGGAVLVLNPKAGGAGLNITAATHVIHYNLEWNPALEDQASARAHRRGQTRPVTVRRLFCADTVEDVVNDRVLRKRQISGAAIVGTQGRDEDYADVIAALQRSPSRGAITVK